MIMTQKRDHIPADARLGAVALGAGALGFGLLGILAPGRLSRMMGIDEDAARAVGLRDVGNGVAFVLAPTRAAALQRMLYDLGDALAFGRRKPAVAWGATSFAVLAAWTAWRAR
jgi:hypothetical protein